MQLYQTITWHSATGQSTPIHMLDHQYLSNIIWFKEIFNNATRYNDVVYFELNMELHRRFEGKRLEWRPLPIPSEIEWLKNIKSLRPDGSLVIPNTNTIIGTITHINNWQNL